MCVAASAVAARCPTYCSWCKCHLCACLQSGMDATALPVLLLSFTYSSQAYCAHYAACAINFPAACKPQLHHIFLLISMQAGCRRPVCSHAPRPRSHAAGAARSPCGSSRSSCWASAQQPPQHPLQQQHQQPCINCVWPQVAAMTVACIVCTKQTRSMCVSQGVAPAAASYC